MALIGYNDRRDTLSQRQLVCMQGRSLGISPKNIAEYIGIKPGTVVEHIRRAYAKLRVHTGNEAKKWLEDNDKYISEKDFIAQFIMNKPPTPEEDKERLKRQAIIHNAQAKAMSIAIKGI